MLSRTISIIRECRQNERQGELGIMNIADKKGLVVGSGISGVGAVVLLSKVGAVPVLFDSNQALTEEEIRSRLPEGIVCEIIVKDMKEEEKSEIDFVVVSPGVPTDTPFLNWFIDRKIPILGEIELAYRFARGNVLAITGTNGKTTTTALLGQIMRDYFKSVYVVGNIGNPYTEIALNTREETVTVAEISSFQLETIDTFKPKISAILNITPDHLDRHHTMENYVAAKEAIARNQTESETCVLNYEDAYTRDFGKRTKANVFYFSSAQKLQNGIYLDGDRIQLDFQGETKDLLSIHEMKLLGIHNVENVMAAMAMAISFSVPLDSILTTVKAFQSVEHRIEYVATKRNVAYYNDSKGTNTDAAIKGIRAMNRPTILIGGGYDKGSRYDEWIEAFDGNVKYLVLLGQTKEKIAECAKKHGFTNIIFAETLEEAVSVCEEKAESGDAVLLSPACASWGMFPNYEVRGTCFKELVNSIKE